MLLILIIIGALLVLLTVVRPGTPGAGSMSARWLEEERASHPD